MPSRGVLRARSPPRGSDRRMESGAMQALADEVSRLDPDWQRHLGDALATAKGEALLRFLAAREADGAEILPPAGERLTALRLTPFSSVRVVIIGQDPYHDIGQAMGLAFSVGRGVRTPPSLRNIYTEVVRCEGGERPAHGDLSHWARQGVLLLNTLLTVEAHTPGAHQKRGWEAVTDQLISALSAERDGLIFLLWGNHARAKAALVDQARHRVLETSHPSPLGARHGFRGCGHFATVNDVLRARGEAPIRWLD
ncbi:uracil-DNA glycosylase [Natronocella acetinitrilica]|uniref:Uracil-DNA glycosylase n=1 Tax=Natronocella acetinitrilica TaxID=414046 RepID=A0AAE3G566_9GAMM|nr:uracil-DNA glycosylase [Natronocella acetinitrilica]MCP1674608.1 uracil-DNA glycosylase [Natronocella acetinitrilica]